MLTEDEFNPNDGYFKRLGAFTYWVSYLEWGVLGDLAAAENNVPGIKIRRLLGETTTGIAQQVERVIPLWMDAPKLTAWATLAVEALKDVAGRRNHVLHARPAIDPQGQQRLLRDRWVGDERVRFWISDEHLDEQIAAVQAWLYQLEPLRGVQAGYDEVFYP